VTRSAPVAPQAPRRGRLARLLGPLHVTGVVWYRLHRWATAHLPEWAIRAGMPVCVGFFYLVLWPIDRAIERNLRPVLGPSGWWTGQRRALRTLYRYAWCLSERYERLNVVSGETRGELEVEGLEHWRRLHEAPEGFILLSAHVGHWELGSMAGAARSDRVVHLVREEEMDAAAQRFVAGLLARQSGDRYRVHFARPEDPLLGLELLRALRDGAIVALQGDRPRAGGESIRVPMFGLDYALPIGTAALARSAGVRILPVFVFRTGRRRACCVFRTPVRVARTEDRAADLRAALIEIGTHIEWAIRQRPHQWFCFREVWSDSASPSA
jgi:KDO2-lipid IV(A) lauroyltransferase